MSDPKRLKHSPIVVAVDFDSSLANAIKVAGELARRSRSKLILLHAVREWSTYTTSSLEGNMSLPLGEVMAANLQTEIEDARQQLNDTAAALRKDLQVEIKVVAGIPNQVIVAEAVLTQAQVLILGSPVDSWRRKEHRLSTLLSVLSEAPCPVLVVGSEPLDEKIEAVAIADDLTPWSKSAVTAAFYFAEAMDAPHVYHLHVNPLQRERFAQALRRYAMRQGTQVRPEAASEFFKDLEHDLSLQLRERAGEETVWFPEREGRYTASVLHGPVLDTIESAISKDQGWNAGLIVFGQHRSFHRRPFRAGNVPFSEMARLGKLALIVPPEAA